MSWIDRLAGNIILLSPSGITFTALWSGSDRSKSKSLGVFKPPKIKGQLVQDLDVGATSYPMSIFFDGTDHDLISDLFFKALDETGAWTVTHPIHGNLTLQLVSVTQKDQPISSGNITAFELEWITPLAEDNIISSAELSEQIQAQLIQLNENASDQLNDVAKQDSVSKIQALKNSAAAFMNTIKEGLSSISELSADIARITNDLQRSLNTELLNPLITLNSIATQIQQVAQLPALVQTSIGNKFSAFTALTGAMLTAAPSNPTPEAKNESSIKELSLIAVVSSLPVIVSTGELQTRRQAMELAELMSDTFKAMTDNLDAIQDLYSSNDLGEQYFSQSSSYADMYIMVSLGIKYLLTASFELRIEKRFILESDRTPIDIAITEYGTLGEDDINLDLFIESNDLTNEEILLLRAGREVLVYV